MSVDMNLVKVAVDAYRGNVEKYSVGQSMDLLREAMVELNGGSTVLNYRNIRDGKCNGLFALVEEVLTRTTIEGLQEGDFPSSLYEIRNVAEGDQNIFRVEDDNLFVVAELADGTQGVRRQRLGGATEVSIPTAYRAVKIYEEMNRVLAGRVDFNDMINRVGESFRKKLLDEVFALWSTATATQFGGSEYFPAAGTYDEDALLDVISHVEATSGKTATLICTKKAARRLAPSIQGIESKSDLYTMGYYGSFYGSPVQVIPQRHKMNTTQFAQPDDIITVIATDEKPIKIVYEGDGLIIPGNPIDNADLTYEYLMAEKYGMGIVLAGANSGIGRYQFV